MHQNKSAEQRAGTGDNSHLKALALPRLRSFILIMDYNYHATCSHGKLKASWVSSRNELLLWLQRGWEQDGFTPRSRRIYCNTVISCRWLTVTATCDSLKSVAFASLLLVQLFIQGLRHSRRIQFLPVQVDAIPIKINWLKSDPASSVAKERKISVAHEKTAGAESHLALAAALWQQSLAEEIQRCKQRLEQDPILRRSPGDMHGRKPWAEGCSLTMCGKFPFISEGKCVCVIYLFTYLYS